jgi:hypothetical protein
MNHGWRQWSPVEAPAAGPALTGEPAPRAETVPAGACWKPRESDDAEGARYQRVAKERATRFARLVSLLRRELVLSLLRGELLVSPRPIESLASLRLRCVEASALKLCVLC